MQANAGLPTTEQRPVTDSYHGVSVVDHYASSPHHHVARGQHYPAMFLLTGDNDPKVEPMQSRKMAAQLQAAVADSGTAVLFSSQPASGHGGDMPLERRISERSDVFAFMLSQLSTRFKR